MRRSSYICGYFLPLLGLLAMAHPAFAADPIAEAKALFDQGLADLEAGKYGDACTEIAESQRLDPHPGTLFTLATCESRRGRVATATARFGEYLALYDTLTSEQKKRQKKRSEVAKAERDKLSAEIPELTLSLPPDAPAGTIIKLGGATFDAALLGISRPIDPGEYVVSTQVPGGPIDEQRITIDKKDKKSVLLEVKAPPVVVPPPPVAPPPPPVVVVPPPPKLQAQPLQPKPEPLPVDGTSTQRKAAYIVGGFGLAGLALGGVTGALTLSKKSLVNDNCGSAIGQTDDHRCTPDKIDAIHNAQTLGLVSTVSIAAGLAGATTGLILLLTDHKPPPAKAGTTGRWLSAEVLPEGPSGAVLHVHGAW